MYKTRKLGAELATEKVNGSHSVEDGCVFGVKIFSLQLFPEWREFGLVSQKVGRRESKEVGKKSKEIVIGCENKQIIVTQVVDWPVFSYSLLGR